MQELRVLSLGQEGLQNVCTSFHWGWQRMRWHYWLNGHEYEQTPGGSEAQGSLASCSLWRKLDVTQRLNNFHYLRLHDHHWLKCK